MSRHIREDYLNGAAQLKPFYAHSPVSPDFSQIISEKSREKIDRAALYESIKAQYHGLQLGPKASANLESLKNPNTFTLTTGHQIVLFGGPLYTIYKVVTIIKLAEQLKEKHPNFHFVPIFWIHTEDHDFEEINHYYSSFQQKHTYAGKFEGMVGDHILTEQIKEVIPPQFEDALQASYQPGVAMKDAYRTFMHQLFDEYGLLMLDANAPALKRSFAPILEQELGNHLAQTQLNNTSRELDELDYKLQIKARDINLFYVDEGLRARISKVNGRFKAIGTELSWTLEEIQGLAQTSPEKFSPNVCLRPLYQEKILPNLAYVGGWAEVAYWMQLKGIFKEAGVAFPLLLPRMSATVAGQSQLDAWSELGMEKEDFRKPIASLNRKYVQRFWDSSSFDQGQSEILSAVRKLHDQIAAESQSLGRTADALHTKTEKYLKNLEKKLMRHVRQKNAKHFKEMEQLKRAIQDDPLVQERTWSLAALSISPKEFVQKVYTSCNPLDYSHQYLIHDA